MWAHSTSLLCSVTALLVSGINVYLWWSSSQSERGETGEERQTKVVLMKDQAIQTQVPHPAKLSSDAMRDSFLRIGKSLSGSGHLGSSTDM